MSSSKISLVKLGLQKGLFQNSLKPRAKKMGGEEKKSGAKGRSKAIEIGLDSDDDEPIGSLFKLKRHRNPKRLKQFQTRLKLRKKNWWPRMMTLGAWMTH